MNFFDTVRKSMTENYGQDYTTRAHELSHTLALRGTHGSREDHLHAADNHRYAAKVHSDMAKISNNPMTGSYHKSMADHHEHMYNMHMGHFHELNKD
jgi:hypothetical protein